MHARSTASSDGAPGGGLRRWALALVYLASFAVLGYLVRDGLPYYLTPLAERPRHEAYWLLKPGGSRGHLLGIVGASLMVVMQLYIPRKRLRSWRRLGKLRHWLDFHIYCGVMGPLLIVLHSSFKVQGLVALSFWSMVAVALSGIVGRYLYLQLPRRRSGDEMSLEETRQRSAEIAARLEERFELGEESLRRLDELAALGVGARTPLVWLLLRRPFAGVALRLRLASFRRSLRRRLPAGVARELGRLALQRAVLERRILLLGRLQELFYYWHVFHKPFAVVMYVFMFVHIGVAIATGYAWGAR